MTRRLVITADDLGRDPHTTAEIVALAHQDALTATTLIPVSEHSVAAAAAIRPTDVEPHLHVTLSSEGRHARWRPLCDAPSLRDEDGHLPRDAAAVERRADAADIVAELDAQLSWMHEQGLRPRAADSHAGVLYGRFGRPFLLEALRWCAERDLGFRLPRDPFLLLGRALPDAVAVLHQDAVALADQLQVPVPAAIVTNSRTAEELGTYENLRGQMISLVSALPEGTSELFLHPAEQGSGIPQVRVWEARLLRDPIWRRALEAEGLDLVEEW